jgi:DNA repair protein SbcC/Rad50
MLRSDDARFFSERCYLAQSTLGRLLEIYQYTDPRQNDSALTRFVKDLLGLDQLDSLVEGLHAARDVRRIRRLVPQYRETEEQLSRISDEIANGRSQFAKLSEQSDVAREALVKDLDQLFAAQSPAPTLERLDEIESLLLARSEEQQLVNLSKWNRQLLSLRDEWQSVSVSLQAEEREAFESRERAATARATEWKAMSGRKLEVLIADLRGWFADLPSPANIDPEYARATALNAVETELKRCSRQLGQDDADGTRIASLEQEGARSAARRSALQQQISELGAKPQALSTALAQLLPHIQGEECPVCGRDFSEISKEPLVARRSSRISQMTEPSRIVPVS